MSYWDSACLIKLYIDEPDSAIFRAHGQHGEVATSSELARLEFVLTLRRKEAEGVIAKGAATKQIELLDGAILAGFCRLTAVDDDVRAEFERVVEKCYLQTPPIFIRTIDALHVAAALAVGETEIVATDRKLRDAATLLGFQLFPTPTP